MSGFEITLAQENFVVGDLYGNFEKIERIYLENLNSDLVVFPELAITGYPPEDLLFLEWFLDEVFEYQERIVALTEGENTGILFGGILREGVGLFNAAYFVRSGKIEKTIKKNSLPNYGVFDEKRYFLAHEGYDYIELKGKRFLVLICEDIWEIDESSDFGDAIISINASPFEIGKEYERLDVVGRFGVPVFYLNLIGGQDSLVFDGSSFVTNSRGEIVFKMKEFESEVASLGFADVLDMEELRLDYMKPVFPDYFLNEGFTEERRIYKGIVLAFRDYVRKNGMKSVLIGLSGGVDSAFCAVVARDALGAENVHLVRMPSKFTSRVSFDDANELIDRLGVGEENVYDIAIDDILQGYEKGLGAFFEGREKDVTEENLQARIRGGLLMALSNKLGHLVVATSNKSESAVGYATMYGDMCGAFSPIKDVYKTLLYKLCRWRNENKIQGLTDVIPENIIVKAPTAELRENQKDSDSLPEYKNLDQILYHLIEMRGSKSAAISLGFEKEEVERVASLLKNSEYKRYQAALGVKITKLSFDKERRFPISNGMNK
jgi:NAD+ synthetase